jgi:hypothetical protein
LGKQAILEYTRKQEEKGKRQEQLALGGASASSSPKKGLQPFLLPEGLPTITQQANLTGNNEFDAEGRKKWLLQNLRSGWPDPPLLSRIRKTSLRRKPTPDYLPSVPPEPSDSVE